MVGQGPQILLVSADHRGVDAQSRSVVHVPLNAGAIRCLVYDVSLPQTFWEPRQVEAPTEDAIALAVRKIRRDVAEEAAELYVTAVVLLTESRYVPSGTGLFGWALNSGVLKRYVGAGFLNREPETGLLAELEAIADLRIANGDLAVGTLEVQRVRSGIGILKVGKGLADQEVLGLGVGMPQARRGGVGAEEIGFHVETNIAQVLRRAPGSPGSSGSAGSTPSCCSRPARPEGKLEGMKLSGFPAGLPS